MSDNIEGYAICDIKIMEEFEDTPPSAKKMMDKERYYIATDRLPGEIVLNNNGVLIDGYITYLLAKKYGYINVLIERGYIEVIEARYKPNGKLYRWKVPRRLQGRVRVGDVATVWGKHFEQDVIVESVEQIQYWERPLKDILQIKCR